VDGLLLTRRERLRGYSERMGLIVGPSGLLALVGVALGIWASAAFMAAVAGMVAVAAGSSLRTRRGAAVFGLCLAAAIFVFMILVALVMSHPILKGD
jgi:hypothetical protein